MPKLMDDSMETGNINGLQKFQFSNTKIERLGATEYTLVTVAIDVTGSTAPFSLELKDMLKSIVTFLSDPKNPRKNNLLLRVIKFSSALPNSIEELHGFKLLSEINVNDYPQFNPQGMTPLLDAIFSSVGATLTYAKKLTDQDFQVNGIVFVITDGCDNDSSATAKMIKAEMEKSITSEDIESLIGILIGINVQNCKTELIKVQQETNIKFIDAKDVTKGSLLKIGEFVSQSISSQSQSLGTGGPSQNIAVTI